MRFLNVIFKCVEYDFEKWYEENFDFMVIISYPTYCPFLMESMSGPSGHRLFSNKLFNPVLSEYHNKTQQCASTNDLAITVFNYPHPIP